MTSCFQTSLNKLSVQDCGKLLVLSFYFRRQGALVEKGERLFCTLHCKNRSVLSTLICPNTHTKNVLVCVLGQISMLNTPKMFWCVYWDKSVCLTHFCFYSVRTLEAAPKQQLELLCGPLGLRSSVFFRILHYNSVNTFFIFSNT